MIVEFEGISDALRYALDAAPNMMIRVEQLDSADDVPMRNIFWASGGDFEAFEAAMEDDPSIRDPTRLAKTPTGRLYSVEYPPNAPDVEAYRAMVDVDAIILSVYNEGDNWFGRFRFPSSEAMKEFRERTEAAGFPLSLRTVYYKEHEKPDEEFGLTKAQREVLLAAVEKGYFEIPRNASLSDLGAELGISSQATSERLRRGMERLVRATLGDGPE